jgi:hypothetical protein
MAKSYNSTLTLLLLCTGFLALSWATPLKLQLDMQFKSHDVSISSAGPGSAAGMTYLYLGQMNSTTNTSRMYAWRSGSCALLTGFKSPATGLWIDFPRNMTVNGTSQQVQRWQCTDHIEFVDGSGSIQAQGVQYAYNDDTKTPFNSWKGTLAVVGGTGKWIGVAGEQIRDHALTGPRLGGLTTLRLYSYSKLPKPGYVDN